MDRRRRIQDVLHARRTPYLYTPPQTFRPAERAQRTMSTAWRRGAPSMCRLKANSPWLKVPVIDYATSDRVVVMDPNGKCHPEAYVRELFRYWLPAVTDESCARAGCAVCLVCWRPKLSRRSACHDRRNLGVLRFALASFYERSEISDVVISCLRWIQ